MCLILGLILFVVFIYFVFGWSGIIVCCIVIAIMAVFKYFELQEEDEERKRKWEEKRKQIEEEKEKERKRKEELDKLYGTCVKEINKSHSSSGLKNPIYVYEDSKVIILNDEPIKFADIINCSVSDDKYTKKGDMKVNTTTNTGSMVGRAVVGDLVAGPAGAIIGGTTAKKESVIKQGDEKTVHDFTVLVNMNSLARPIIRVYFGEDGKSVNELTSILNIIIRENNSLY